MSLAMSASCAGATVAMAAVRASCCCGAASATTSKALPRASVGLASPSRELVSSRIASLRQSKGLEGFGCCSFSPSSSSGAVVRAKEFEASASRRLLHIARARRPPREVNGGVMEAAESMVPTVPENQEPDDMFMGRKLEGLEPDFWEGEQWDTLGFIIQYFWAFGILISLVACGVAVTSYNSGATDIRNTAIFKEALENQVESDSSFDSDDAQDFPVVTDAPPLE